MRIKKFFILKNYTSRLKSIGKSIRVSRLAKQKILASNLNFFWRVNFNKALTSPINYDFSWQVFGKKINLNAIEWHKDYISGFTFPIKRFDKLKLNAWYNKGIEIKFPWETSRFYFAVNLGQNYLLTGDEVYYNTFKTLVLDWLEKNPFLFGVNWVSTMETAIRAVNWIIAANFFSSSIEKDKNFKDQISISLNQHAEYIFNFPEIYDNGLTTNHTTACYAGLLFLALTLRDNKNSDEWIRTAISGLEHCIRDQVYDDGGDFEASIFYHRLVLEMFAFACIAGIINDIKFSTEFYSKLYKMFEFTASYIDEKGNAPQIGDNDSGRLIILDSKEFGNTYEYESNHLYLLELGEVIFPNNFIMNHKKNFTSIKPFFPLINNTEPFNLQIKPTNTQCSIRFEKSGLYVLKNETFSMIFSNCPLGQHGRGGHNHFDVGSFTLSLKGEQIIVDPGTFVYTTDKKKRDRFRQYIYHNTIYTEIDKNINWDLIDYWELPQYYYCRLLNFSEEMIIAEIKFKNDENLRYRKFTMIGNSIEILDKYPGKFYSRINFHPNIVLTIKKEKEIEAGSFNIEFENAESFNISEYEYSPGYGRTINSKCVIFEACNYLQLKIISKLC